MKLTSFWCAFCVGQHLSENEGFHKVTVIDLKCEESKIVIVKCCQKQMLFKKRFTLHCLLQRKQTDFFAETLFAPWFHFVDENEIRMETKHLSNGTLESVCCEAQTNFKILQTWNTIWAWQHFGRKTVNSGESWNMLFCAVCVHIKVQPAEEKILLSCKHNLFWPQPKIRRTLEFLTHLAGATKFWSQVVFWSSQSWSFLKMAKSGHFNNVPHVCKCCGGWQKLSSRQQKGTVYSLAQSFECF